jgi:hypothetical protein
MPRTKVPDKEWKIVLARSGGICAFPSCGTNLIRSGGGQDDTAFVGDIAHIVADSRQGPRGDVEMSDADRDKHPNLLLLCPTCHDRVDKQPRTFSIPVLRRIKEEHELQIAAAATPVVEDDGAEMKKERILSSLMPVTHLPMAVFAAPCGYGDRQDAVIKQYLKYPNDKEQIIRFLVREKTLFSFHDLRDPDGPFSPVIDVNKVEKYRSERFWSTAEGHRRFITLFNRALYRYTAKLGINYDPAHQRFYFPVLKPGEERSVSYRPLNRQSDTRQVAWEEKRKKTGEGKGFWWHLAAGLRFHRLADDQWCLSIRPERHLTTNGVIPLPPEKIGRKVTRLKAGMFNDKYLSEVNFWRDYLSGGSPRFTLDFGSQSLVISTDFLSFDVSWPGIPGDEIKFRNQEYEEDLFTLATLGSLKQGEGDLDWDDEDGDEAFDADSADSE